MTQVTAIDPYWLGGFEVGSSPWYDIVDEQKSVMQPNLGKYSTLSRKRTSMAEALGRKWIASSRGKPSSKWRWPGNAKSTLLTLIRVVLVTKFFSGRTARQEAEEKIAAKTSSAKISVPGTPRTPRNVGVGAGARIVQTPRRRLGI